MHNNCLQLDSVSLRQGRFDRSQSLACVFLVLVVAAVYCPLVHAQANLPAIDMRLKPRLCIRGTSNDVCNLQVSILWRGDALGEYCLYSESSGEALRCWERELSGATRDQITIEKNLDYWLAWQPTNVELARKTLKVLTAKSDDRRRSRRRRHVWSVF